MDFNPEVFKPIYYEGIETDYVINCEGIVVNKKSGYVLKPYIPQNNPYYKVGLYVRPLHKTKHLAVHRLVAMAFIPNPENKPCVNHIDGNKLNDHVTNLEWVTFQENTLHALRTGLKPDVVLPIGKVHEVCRLLETGKYTNKQIAQVVGSPCTKRMVDDIRTRNSWTSISKYYKLPKVRKFKVKWKDYRKKVDDLIMAGYTNKQIFKLIDIPGSNKSSFTVFISNRKKALRDIGLIP